MVLRVRLSRCGGGFCIGCLLPAVLLAVSGCGEDEIDQAYGFCRGSHGRASVNGVGVLADMFRQHGHRVATARHLSPKLERCDTIVWAPDDFEPPRREQREFLEEWLSARPIGGRTLVYIGRDYNAAAAYWAAVRLSAPPEQAEETIRRRAKALADHDRDRMQMPKERYAGWFVARRDKARRAVRELQSPAGGWSDGIDPSKAEIEVEGRLDIPQPSDRPRHEQERLPEFEAILRSRGDAIVTRVTNVGWGRSKILVVANGSFLLNLPLVNRQHRKLAGRLIAECGPPGGAVFLESGPGGPPVLRKDPKTRYPTGLEILTVWPLNAIVLHLTALGLLFCFARVPIFGEPRDLDQDPVLDFGKHVDAVGDLLRRTRDHAYAAGRLAHYQHSAQRESGARHASRGAAGCASAQTGPHSGVTGSSGAMGGLVRTSALAQPAARATFQQATTIRSCQ
jgi:hypothetical protein